MLVKNLRKDLKNLNESVLANSFSTDTTAGKLRRFIGKIFMAHNFSDYGPGFRRIL